MSSPSSTILATPQTWNWQCPQPLTHPMKSMVFIALQSYWSFRAHFQAPKLIFENVFKMVPYVQIWLLMTFWMSQSDWEYISDHLQALGKIWRNKNFPNFFNFFAAIVNVSFWGQLYYQSWKQIFSHIPHTSDFLARGYFSKSLHFNE